ncbi:MAG: FAD-dependent oxidoreductase [Candidatus Hodarchaeota archaeon]
MSEKKKRVVIIGGDAAGLSAASAIRRFQKDWDIVVYEKGEYISYASCGIPYFIADWVKDQQSMITITKEEFLEKRNIPVKIFHELKVVDVDKKQVLVEDIQNNNEFHDSWDFLVIATGANPRVLPIPGANLPRVFKVKGLDTGIEIKKFIKENNPKSACLIGAGFIGLEMAEGFKEAGIEDITMVEVMPRLLPAFTEKISGKVLEELERNGIKVCLQEKVKEIKEIDGGKLEVALDGTGKSVIVDLVLMGTGIAPNTAFLEGSGIRLDAKGAVDVDEFMQTNVPGVWAAGDCANINHILLGERVYYPLATNANKQGRYAGYTIGGKRTAFPGTMGTLITKIFDVSVSRTGLTLEQAKSKGHDAVEVSITHEDMARYFPGSSEVIMSIVVDAEKHVILGGCIAGSPIAAKKIDMFVAFIASKMKIEDIQMLDLSYAPPFSPVYDAILIIASVARKKLK